VKRRGRDVPQRMRDRKERERERDKGIILIDEGKNVVQDRESHNPKQCTMGVNAQHFTAKVISGFFFFILFLSFSSAGYPQG
jgi:hypothetical protein